MANRRRRKRKERGQARAATVDYADVKLQRDAERVKAADERQRLQQQRVETRGALGRQMTAQRKAREIAARAGREADPTFRTFDPDTGRATTLKGAETEFERQHRERMTGTTKPTPFFRVPGAEGDPRDKDDLVLTGGATRLEDVRRAGIKREVETQQTGTATTELPVSEQEREQLARYYPRVERTGEAAAVEQFEGVELAVHGELAEFNRQAQGLRKELAARAELLDLDPDQIEALDLDDEQLESNLLGGLAPRVRAMRAIREEILGRLNQAAEATNRAREAQTTTSPETQERMKALGPKAFPSQEQRATDRSDKELTIGGGEAAVADDNKRAIAKVRALAAKSSAVKDRGVPAAPPARGEPGANAPATLGDTLPVKPAADIPPEDREPPPDAAQRLKDRAIIQRARERVDSRNRLGDTASPREVVMRVRRAGQTAGQTTVGKYLDLLRQGTFEERNGVMGELQDYMKQTPDFKLAHHPALQAAVNKAQKRLDVERALVPKDAATAAAITSLANDMRRGTVDQREEALKQYDAKYGKLDRADYKGLQPEFDSIERSRIAIKRDRDKKDTLDRATQATATKAARKAQAERAEELRKAFEDQQDAATVARISSATRDESQAKAVLDKRTAKLDKDHRELVAHEKKLFIIDDELAANKALYDWEQGKRKDERAVVPLSDQEREERRQLRVVIQQDVNRLRVERTILEGKANVKGSVAEARAGYDTARIKLSVLLDDKEKVLGKRAARAGEARLPAAPPPPHETTKRTPKGAPSDVPAVPDSEPTVINTANDTLETWDADDGWQVINSRQQGYWRWLNSETGQDMVLGGDGKKYIAGVADKPGWMTVDEWPTDESVMSLVRRGHLGGDSIPELMANIAAAGPAAAATIMVTISEDAPELIAAILPEDLRPTDWQPPTGPAAVVERRDNEGNTWTEATWETTGARISFIKGQHWEFRDTGSGQGFAYSIKTGNKHIRDPRTGAYHPVPDWPSTKSVVDFAKDKESDYETFLVMYMYLPADQKQEVADWVKDNRADWIGEPNGSNNGTATTSSRP